MQKTWHPDSVYSDLQRKAAHDSTTGRALTPEGVRRSISIARHHFKPGLWKMKREQTKKWGWTEPLSKESVTQYGALSDNFYSDREVRFDSIISNKAANGRQKKESIEKEERKYIKAPCASLQEVWKIANSPITVDEMRAVINSKDVVINALKKQLEESNADNKKKDAKLKELKKKFEESKKDNRKIGAELKDVKKKLAYRDRSFEALSFHAVKPQGESE